MDESTPLFHVGVPRAEVPERVVLVESGLQHEWPERWHPRRLARRREFDSTALVVDGHPVLAVAGGFGAPAVVIALEELARAGAGQVLGIGACHCSGPGCPHGVTPVLGAVRGEGTSYDYAPAEFPAVPDAGLLQALVAGVGATARVVRTVDCPPGWLDGAPVATGEDPPVDLQSAALLVASAAAGLAAVTLTVPPGGGPVVARAVEAFAAAHPLPRPGGPT